MADEIFVGKLLVDDSQLQETFETSKTEIDALKNDINNFMTNNSDTTAVGMTDKFAQVNTMLQQIDSSVERASKIFSNSTNLIDSEGALRSLQVIKTSMEHTFADLKTTMSESLAFTTKIGVDNITKMDKAMKPYLGQIRKSMMKEAADWRDAGRANLTDEEFTSYFMKSDDYKNILSHVKTGDNAKLLSQGNMRSYIRNVVAANLPQYLRADFNPNSERKLYPESFEASLPDAFKNMPRSRDNFDWSKAEKEIMGKRQAESDMSKRLTEREFQYLENLAKHNRYAQDALVDAGVLAKANGGLYRVLGANRGNVNAAAGNVMELIVAGAKGQAGDKVNVDSVKDWMSTIRYRTNQKYINGMNAARALSDNFEWLTPIYSGKIVTNPEEVVKNADVLSDDYKVKYSFIDDIKNGVRKDQFESEQYVYTLNDKGEIVLDKSRPSENYIGDSIHLRTLGYNPNKDNGAEIASKIKYIKIGDEMSKRIVEEQDKIAEARKNDDHNYTPSAEYTNVRNWLTELIKNGYINPETGAEYGVSRMNMHAGEGVIELVEKGLLNDAIARDPTYFTGGYESGHVFKKGEYGQFARAIDNMNRNASDGEDIRRMLGVDASDLNIAAVAFSQVPGLKNFDGINYISNRLTTQGFQGRGEYIKGTFSPLSMGYLFDLYKDKIETDDSGKEFLTLPSVGGQTTRIYRDTDAIIDVSTQKANEEFKNAQGKWLSPAEIEEKIRGDFKDKGAMVMKTYKEGNTGSQWIGHQMANTFSLDDEARKYFLKVFQNNMRLLDTEEGARALVFGGDPDVDIKSDIAQERIAETKLSWLKQFNEGDLMLPAANSMMYGMAGAWPVNAFNAAFRYLGKNITDEQKELELADKDVLWNLSGANELMLGRWPHAYNGSQKVINVLSKNGNKEKADRFAKVMERAGMDANGLYISPTSPILQYMQSEDFDGDLNTIIELTNGRDEEFSRIMLSVYSKTLEQDAKERATNPNAVSENAQKRRAALRSINPFADDPNKTWSLDSAEDKADYILNSLPESRKMGLASAVSARTQQLGRNALTLQAKIDAANHYDRVSTWHKDMADWALTREEKAILAYGPLLGEIYKQMNNAMVEGTVTDEYGEATKTIGFDKDKFFSGNGSNFDKMNFASINSPSDLLRMMTAANLRSIGIDPNEGYDFDAMLKSLPTFATEEETGLANRIRKIRMDMAQYKYLGLSDKTINELDEMIASTRKAVRADIVKNNPNMSPKEVDYAVAQRLKLTGAEAVENTKEFGWTKRNMGLEKNRDMADSARYAAEAYGIQILDDGTVPESFDTINDKIIEQRIEVKAAKQRLEEEKKAEEEAIKNARSQREKQHREKKEQEQQKQNQKTVDKSEQVSVTPTENEPSNDKPKEQTEPTREASNDNKTEQENPEKNETQEESTAKPEEDKTSEKSIREIFNEKARELYNRYQNKELDKEQFAKEINSLYDAIGEDPFSASDIKLDIDSIIKNKGEMPAEFGFVDELISENEDVRKTREAREAAVEEVKGEETKLASLLPAGEIGNAIASQNKALEYGEYLDSLSDKYASKYFKYYMEGMSGKPHNGRRFNPWMNDELSLAKSYQKIREEEAAGVDDATLNANRSRAEQAKAEFDSALRMAAAADLAEAAEYFGSVGDSGSITKKYEKQIQAVRDTLATKSNAYDVLRKRESDAKKEGRSLSDEDQEALKQAKEQKLRAEQAAADAEFRLNNLKDEEIDKKSFDMMSKARAYTSGGLFGRYSSQAETGFRNRKDLFSNMQKHYKDLDPNSAEGKNFAKAMDRVQGRLARESNGKGGEIGYDLGFMGKLSGITDSLMSRFSYRIFMTIINSIKKFVKEIWNAAKEYDAAMLAIERSTGKTDADVSKLSENFKTIAKNIHTTSTALLKVAADLYNLDFSDSQINEYIESIAQFDKLTGVSTKSSGKLALEVEESGYAYEDINDILYKIGEEAYGKIDEVTSAFNVMGNLPFNAGTSVNDITALILSAIMNGANGLQTGESMQAAYRRLGDMQAGKEYVTDKNGNKTTYRSDNISALLSSVGINPNADIFSILSQLIGKWSSFSETEKTAISNAVAGSENASNFTATMDATSKDEGKMFEKNKDKASIAAGSIDEAEANKVGTLTGEIERLSAAWQQLTENLANNKVAMALATGLTRLIESISNLTSTTAGSIGTLMLFATALSAIAIMIGYIRGGAPGAIAAAVISAGVIGTIASVGILGASSRSEKQSTQKAPSTFSSTTQTTTGMSTSEISSLDSKIANVEKYRQMSDRNEEDMMQYKYAVAELGRTVDIDTSSLDGLDLSASEAAAALDNLADSATGAGNEILKQDRYNKSNDQLISFIEQGTSLPVSNTLDYSYSNVYAGISESELDWFYQRHPEIPRTMENTIYYGLRRKADVPGEQIYSEFQGMALLAASDVSSPEVLFTTDFSQVYHGQQFVDRVKNKIISNAIDLNIPNAEKYDEWTDVFGSNNAGYTDENGFTTPKKYRAFLSSYENPETAYYPSWFIDAISGEDGSYLFNIFNGDEALINKFRAYAKYYVKENGFDNVYNDLLFSKDKSGFIAPEKRAELMITAMNDDKNFTYNPLPSELSEGNVFSPYLISARNNSANQNEAVSYWRANGFQIKNPFDLNKLVNDVNNGSIPNFDEIISSSEELIGLTDQLFTFENGQYKVRNKIDSAAISAFNAALNKETGIYDTTLSIRNTAGMAQYGQMNGVVDSDGIVNLAAWEAMKTVFGDGLAAKMITPEKRLDSLESNYSNALLRNYQSGFAGLSAGEKNDFAETIFRIASGETVEGYEGLTIQAIANSTDQNLLSDIYGSTAGLQDFVNMNLALNNVGLAYDENGNMTDEAIESLEKAGYSVEAYRIAQEDLDATLKTSSSSAMKEYGRSTDAVNDAFKNLKGTAQQANSVVKNLNQNISSGASLEYTKGQFAKGVQTEEDYEAAASALGWDKKQLKELFTPEQITDMLSGSLEASYEATDEAINGWFDVVEEKLSANGGTIDIQGPDFNMQPGKVYGLAEASSLAIAAGQNELAATLSALEGMGAEAFLEVIQGDDGKIKLQFKTNSYGGGSKGGGGGGGGKSQVQKLIDKLKHERELTDHWLKMINYDETLYENRGQYANENRLINIENEYRQTTQIPQLEQQLVQLKEKFSSTKVESDDWYSLRQEIQSTEEALSEARNSIDDNTRKIQENMQKIAKTRSDMEDAVTGEFDTRLEEAKNQLNAEVDMQNTILEAIKQRYQDEWDLQKEDMDRKKQALQDEISMIDERLNARKEAADESSKYEELAELRRQYALISMNEARSKDAAEIAEKIKDLEEEIGWDIAENEAEAQKQALQEESDSIDTRMTEGDKDLENLLSDANNFSDEVNSVLMMNQEDLFAWLKANVQEYTNSLDEAQSQMVIGWTETYQQMKEIAYAFWNELTGTMELADAETYWEKIVSPFVENDALFASLMMDSTQFKNASDAQQYQMLYEWGLLEGQEYEGLVNNYHNAHLNDATFEHSDEWAKIIETVKQSITSSSSGRRYSENPLMENPFGSNVDALKAYQSANGLTPDGVWGKYTQYVWEQQHKSGNLVDKEALTELSVYDELKTDAQTKYTILDTNKNAVDEVIKKNEGTNIVTMFGDLSPEAAMSLIQSYATAGTMAADIYRNMENVVARAAGKETAEKAKDIVGHSEQRTEEEGTSVFEGGKSGSTNIIVYDPDEQSRLQAIVDADPLTEEVELVAFDESGNYNPHLVSSESVVPSEPTVPSESIIESTFKDIYSIIAAPLYDIRSYLEDNTEIVLFDEHGESNPHTVFVGNEEPESHPLRTSDQQKMQEQDDKDAAYAEMMTEIYSKQWEDWNKAADDIKRNDRIAAEEAAYMSATHSAEQEYYGKQYEAWLVDQQENVEETNIPQDEGKYFYIESKKYGRQYFYEAPNSRYLVPVDEKDLPFLNEDKNNDVTNTENGQKKAERIAAQQRAYYEHTYPDQQEYYGQQRKDYELEQEQNEFNTYYAVRQWYNDDGDRVFNLDEMGDTMAFPWDIKDEGKAIITSGPGISTTNKNADIYWFKYATGSDGETNVVDDLLSRNPDRGEFPVIDGYGIEYGKIVRDEGGWHFVQRPDTLERTKYANGGLVDFTGPAWVDGTPQQPESFLDATDTKLLRSMLDAFNYVRTPMMSRIDSSMFNNSPASIGEVTITLNEAQFNTDDDYDLIAQKVGESFTRELSKQGLSTININF